MDQAEQDEVWRQLLLRLTRTQTGGATLIEVMVACGVFLLLMTSTIFFYDLSQRSDRKASVHSEAYREAALALRHIRRELIGAELYEVSDDDDAEDERDQAQDLTAAPKPRTGSKLEYRVPQFEGERVIVDHRGNPVWATEHKLEVIDGVLMLRERVPDSSTAYTDVRPIAQVGEGNVTFEIPDEPHNPVANPRVVNVTITVEKTGDFGSDDMKDKSRRELTLTVGLANQQFWEDLQILQKS